jgi:hypothetical protein
MPIDREDWLQHVQSIIRSRHYTWLPEGLGGEPVDVAMTWVLTDVRHICKLAGISFDEILERSGKQFEAEEGKFGTRGPS